MRAKALLSHLLAPCAVMYGDDGAQEKARWFFHLFTSQRAIVIYEWVKGKTDWIQAFIDFNGTHNKNFHDSSFFIALFYTKYKAF